MAIDLDGRVAIVTGAGGGLGRAHALALARYGAKVMVNDLGVARDGRGNASEAAEAVVDEIRSAGGVAAANGGSVSSVSDVQLMVADATERWGRVDILVNNAGILRDKTFAKMTMEDFRAVLEVHLMGTVNCTKAVWNIMREQNYGRIIMTTSSSGLFGNFGQSAYAAAKMAMVGLMNTLHLEGERHNIRINCISPSAATRMTDDIYAPEVLGGLGPESVSPGVVALASDEAPSRVILGAGAGVFERAYVTLTQGLYVGNGEDAAEQILRQLDFISDRTGEQVPASGPEQSLQEVALMRESIDLAGAPVKFARG